MTLDTQILDRAALMFTSARKNLIAGAALLSKIRAEGLYKPDYEYFGDYLEQECQISESFASKLITVYEAYVLNGGVKQAELEGVDHEKLYLARNMPGSFAAKLAKAQLLSRTELKAEIGEKDGVDCIHEDTVKICTHCKRRIV